MQCKLEVKLIQKHNNIFKDKLNIFRKEQFRICLGEIEVKTHRHSTILRGFSLNPLSTDPCVIFTRRCIYSVGHGCREPVHQVKVTLTRQLLNSLDLGLWLVSSFRRNITEPLQCFKCQVFGQSRNTAKTGNCNICCNWHPTSFCIGTWWRGKHQTMIRITMSGLTSALGG